jgi:hypothetical protein
MNYDETADRLLTLVGKEARRVARAEVREATAPTPRPKPKPAPEPTPPAARGRVTITATDNIPPMRPEDMFRMRAAQQPPRPRTDARATDDPCPCLACGGPVEATAARYLGVWRCHDRCESIAWSPGGRVQAAARLLAVGQLDLVDADLVAATFVVPRYSEHRAGVEPTWDSSVRLRDRLPWRHVDRRRLRRAVDTLPKLRREAGLDPSGCTTGACAWCGCAESRGWFADGHVWADDGAAAPLCGECHAVYEAHGSVDPSWWDGQRDGIGEALTRVPPQAGEQAPSALRGFAEVAGQRGGDHAGGARWCHLNADGVETYRWRTWLRFGGALAPAEHREEAQRRAAAREAEGAARRAQEAAEQQAAQDATYGF